MTGAASLLASAVLAHPERPALWVDGVASSYGRLAARVADYQAFARRAGLAHDDRVIFTGPPGLDFYAVLLAGVFGSFTVAFRAHGMPTAAGERLVEALRPVRLIGVADTAEVGVVPRADLDVRDLPRAHLSLTSGTLGHPTAALVDAVALGGFLVWALGELDLGAGDRWFEPGEATSDLALTNALLAFAAGSSFGVVTGPRRVRAADLAAAYGATVTRLVPTVATMLLRGASGRGVRLPSLRVLAFGGDALPAVLPGRLLRAVGARARTLATYGKTELAGFTLFSWFDAVREEGRPDGATVALGGPVPGTCVHIEQSEGDTGPGELVVTSPAVALRLIRPAGRVPVITTKAAPGATATLSTGDLVERVDGDLRFAGRRDRVTKINGVRVNLADLETRIGELAGVDVCALDHDGAIVAVVASRQALSAAQVARPLRDAIPTFLFPAEVVTVPALPRNRTGKVDVSECQRLAWERLDPTRRSNGHDRT